MINLLINIKLIFSTSSSLLLKTNELRKRMKLNLLESLPELDIIAQKQANYMCSIDELSHSNEYNEQLSERLRDYELIGNNIGENIARQQSKDIDSVFNVWSASETHLQNLIGNYTHSGLGNCKSSTGLIYWVQIFYGNEKSNQNDSSSIIYNTNKDNNNINKDISSIKTLKENHHQKIEINEPIRQFGLFSLDDKNNINIDSNRNQKDQLMHIDIGAPYNKQQFISLVQNLVKDTVELVIKKKENNTLNNSTNQSLKENPSLNRNIGNMSIVDLKDIIKDTIKEQLPPPQIGLNIPNQLPVYSNDEGDPPEENIKLRDFIEGLISKEPLNDIKERVNKPDERNEERPSIRNTKRLVDFFEGFSDKNNKNKQQVSQERNRKYESSSKKSELGNLESEFKEWLLLKGEREPKREKKKLKEDDTNIPNNKEGISPDDVLPFLKNLFKQNTTRPIQ